MPLCLTKTYYILYNKLRWCNRVHIDLNVSIGDRYSEHFHPYFLVSTLIKLKAGNEENRRAG